MCPNAVRRFHITANKLEEQIKNFENQLDKQSANKIEINPQAEYLSAVKRVIHTATFDGQTLWSNSGRQFEATEETNGWNNQENATAIIFALRCEALGILSTFNVYPAINKEKAVIYASRGNQRRNDVLNVWIVEKRDTSSGTVES